MKGTLKFLDRNKWTYMLITLQVSAVFALVIIFSSAVKDRTKYYNVCNKDLSTNGIIIKPSAADNIMNNEDDILKIFDKAKSVSGVKSIDLFDDTYDFQGTAMIYSPNVMRAIPPRLESGNFPKENSKFIECLSCDGFGFKTGDIIKLHDNNNNEYNIKICGILSYNQYIYGTGISGEYRYTGDYRDLYYYLSRAGSSSPLLLTTENIANKFNMNPVFRYDSSIIINFPRNTYNSEILNQMAFDNGFQIIGDTIEKNKASVNYVNEQLYTIMPLAIAILIITIFTTITTSVISTIRNLKTYVIYYICGATWKHCAKINLKIYFMILLLSAILNALLFKIGTHTFLKNTVTTITSSSIIICGLIMVTFILLSLFVPIVAVRNVQPREILKKFN